MRRDRETPQPFSVGLQCCLGRIETGWPGFNFTQVNATFLRSHGKRFGVLWSLHFAASRCRRWLELLAPVDKRPVSSAPYRAAVIRPSRQLCAKLDSYRESSQASLPELHYRKRFWSLAAGAKKNAGISRACPTPRSSSGVAAFLLLLHGSVAIENIFQVHVIVWGEGKV
ncbi:hypothetical protein V8E51_012854 [Hyaloscypha variabilis]